MSEETLFHGLSAFPLTPMRDERIDESALARIIERLAIARVDSMTVLGSTGSYAYLSREERARVIRIAMEHRGDVPLIAGVGALRTRHVLGHVEDAQTAGVQGILVAPMSYQALTRDDVYGLYEDVTRVASVPVVIYDNPGTTHFTFDDDLYRAVAQLPGIASIKIPGLPADLDAARERMQVLSSVVPDHVTIGVSGDTFGALGLVAGCDAWYSVIAGTLPELAVSIVRAVQDGESVEALSASAELDPLWRLFARHGSLRVTAAIAEMLGLVARPSLPLLIRGLSDGERLEVSSILQSLKLI